MTQVTYDIVDTFVSADNFKDLTYLVDLADLGPVVDSEDSTAVVDLEASTVFIDSVNSIAFVDSTNFLGESYCPENKEKAERIGYKFHLIYLGWLGPQECSL